MCHYCRSTANAAVDNQCAAIDRRAPAVRIGTRERHGPGAGHERFPVPDMSPRVRSVGGLIEGHVGVVGDGLAGWRSYSPANRPRPSSLRYSCWCPERQGATTIYRKVAGPLMLPAYVPLVAWLKVTLALSVMLPCRLAVVLASEPAETVVPPL